MGLRVLRYRLMIAKLPIRHLWERRSRGAMENIIDSTLDNEWEQMMEEAREIGLTPEDVRQFLRRKVVYGQFEVNETSGNVS